MASWGNITGQCQLCIWHCENIMRGFQVSRVASWPHHRHHRGVRRVVRQCQGVRVSVVASPAASGCQRVATKGSNRGFKSPHPWHTQG